MSDDRLLRIADVTEMVGLSQSEIYKRVKRGRFPAQIRLSHKVARWRLSDVRQWLNSVGEMA